jgi:hypothetical protein
MCKAGTCFSDPRLEESNHCLRLLVLERLLTAARQLTRLPAAAPWTDMSRGTSYCLVWSHTCKDGCTAIALVHIQVQHQHLPDTCGAAEEAASAIRGEAAVREREPQHRHKEGSHRRGKQQLKRSGSSELQKHCNWMRCT